MGYRYVLLLIFSMIGTAKADACEMTNILRGDSEASEVENEWDGSTYKTYLIRNSGRDQNGVLNDWIKFEMIPQRWGFDLELPNGTRFAQVNKEFGKWNISPSHDFIDACIGHSVTLRRGVGGIMEVHDGLARIGIIERFPFGELF